MVSSKNLLLLLLVPASSFGMGECLKFLLGLQNAPANHGGGMVLKTGLNFESIDGSITTRGGVTSLDLNSVNLADSVYADGQRIWGAVIDLPAIRQRKYESRVQENNCIVNHYTLHGAQIVDITGLSSGSKVIINNNVCLQK